jgi:WD40 repeat protein
VVHIVKIRVWDIEFGQCLQTLNVGHTGYIRAIVQITNEIITTGNEKGKIIIWKL